MKRSDLAIRPDLFKAPFTVNRFTRWMENPIKAPLEARQDARNLFEAAEKPATWLSALAACGDIDASPPLPMKPYRDYRLPHGLPNPLKQALEVILDAMHTVNLELAALRDRIPPEKRMLFETYLYPEGCPVKGEPESPENQDTYKKVQEALKAAEDMDRKLLLRSAVTLLGALDRAKELLTEAGDWKDRVRSFSFKTGFGKVTIGGTGPDRHEGERALIIDLGGNDLYEGRTASGSDGNCAIVLDLSGDDVYLGEDATQGAGIWGIGLLLDLSGDDLYRAQNCSQGAGLFGIGLLMDGGGNDRYLGGRFVQAASSWGLGGLLDLGGEDTYECRQSGQAYAGVAGVSSLCDLGGNDKYLSGAGTPDPREPDMNQSFVQGFSMGLRNLAAGGFALLADRSGNDLYQCMYFGQGASYWMGVGLLYDEWGKDTYLARRYAQGAGIHFSLGILLDWDGNDHTVSWGVSQGCGHDYGIGLLINESGDDTYTSDWLSMGASEANGIGIFVDNTGNDGYMNRSGPAVGSLTPARRAGGLGLFMDAGGKDRYAGTGGDDQLWGPNRWAVGVDSEEKGESGLKMPPPLSSPPLNRLVNEERHKENIRLADALVRAEDAPYPLNILELLSVASHWGYGKDLSGVAEKKLLSTDPALSVPALLRYLDTPDIMTLIFLEKFFSIRAFHARPFLEEKSSDPDPMVQSRALYYLGKLKDTRSLEVLSDALDRPSLKVRSNAVGAIGEVLDRKRLEDLVPMKKALDDASLKKDRRALEGYFDEDRLPHLLSVMVRSLPMDVEMILKIEETSPAGEGGLTLEDFSGLVGDHLDELRSLLSEWIDAIRQSESTSKRLVPFIGDPDPAMRKAAAYALGQMNYLPAVPRLLSLLEDPRLWVRDAAVLSLSLFGESALPSVISTMEGASPSFRILALDILSRIKGERSKEMIKKALQDPDQDVRRAARRAMDSP
ncbi:MAG: HEAT repeat domain-containing protein [Pseudomonadota bacterium]